MEPIYEEGTTLQQGEIDLYHESNRLMDHVIRGNKLKKKS